jgi:two-component system cell cycle sensor histidine kinase/response regulator CckA
MGLLRAAVGSLFMGAGIAAMHYIGMAAMRLPAMCRYAPWLVALSVALAIVISFVALWLTFHLRAETAAGGRLKIISALAMGAAIPIMHYTGMAAASFASSPLAPQDLSHAVSVSWLGLVVIVGVTASALGLALLTSTAARRFAVQFTGREEAERALRDTEERMRFALEAAGVGTWNLNLTTGRGEWSRILGALHGADEGGFPATLYAFLEYVHPDDRAMVQEAVQQAIRQRTDWNVVYRTVWSDGSVHSVNEIGRAFYDAAGVPFRTAGVGIDATDRQRLEAQVRQAQKMDAIGRLASGVAHDFNNLLTVILGFAEIVTEDVTVASQHRNDVGEIAKAAQRASGLTKQLLAFSRQQVLHATALDVNALITEMTGMLSRLIGEHIEVMLALAPDLSPAFADRSQLEQVVMNLVVNARDAMPSGGSLTIETTNVDLGKSTFHEEAVTEGSYVMLAITDTGSGMTKETQRRLFEPFFTTKETGKGTGLGLSTTYGIVKQSQGYIWAYSEIGVGTTFKVYLPRSNRDEPLQAVSPAIQASTSTASETLLLVEDESGVRRLSKRILDNAGYRVLEAANGDDAEKIFVQHADSIDLVVTDVIMPGCGGPELLRRLQVQVPALRVLFMSGYTEQSGVHQPGIDRGLPFVQKPFTAAEFLRQVREALDR